MMTRYNNFFKEIQCTFSVVEHANNRQNKLQTFPSIQSYTIYADKDCYNYNGFDLKEEEGETYTTVKQVKIIQHSEHSNYSFDRYCSRMAPHFPQTLTLTYDYGNFDFKWNQKLEVKHFNNIEVFEVLTELDRD